MTSAKLFALLFGFPLLSVSPALAEELPPATLEERTDDGGGGDLGSGSCNAHAEAIREHEQCVRNARTRTDIRNCGPRPSLPPRCE